MGALDLWAAAGVALSLGATAWALRARKRRGPARGFGTAYAALFIAAVVGVVFLHGTVAAGVALALGRTTAGLAALAMHLVVGAWLVKG
jgi:hypothetical protein